MAVNVDRYAEAVIALVASGVEPKVAIATVVTELQKTGFSRWERFARALEKAYDKYAGIVSVRAVSGRAVSQKDQKALQQALGENVEIDWETDERLIGGVKFESHELVIDGTVQGLINKLREALYISNSRE